MGKPSRGRRVVDVRPVDENNQVITVEGDGGYCKQPCSDCPWRKDAVGKFPAEAFRLTANTAYDMADKPFGCHQTASAAMPATCAGFLLMGSYHNMAMRFKRMLGEIDMDKVSDGGHELFDSYRAMAVANGVDPDDPVLRPCRDD